LALLLAQLLQTVDHVEVAVLVGMADVARVQPAVLVEDLLGGGAIIEIALHNLRPADPDLTIRARTERGPRRDVDHLAFGAGNDRTDGADLRPLHVVPHRVGDRAGFGRAVSLFHLAVQTPATGV